MNNNLLAIYTLWHREIVRFYRQKSRVIGGLVPPLVFWIFIGSGLKQSFQAAGTPAGMDYLTFFFPGTMLLIVIFSAIFSSISLIQDRQEGFLQGVLVAPLSRPSLVLGKVLGGASLAFLQGTIFLLLVPSLGISLSAGQAVQILCLLFLTSISMTALGFFFAWRMDSVQGFHAIMNLVLMPLWLLSGSLFPITGVPGWLGILMKINPLSYALSCLRGSFGPDFQLSQAPSPSLALGVTFIFAIITLAGCFWTASKRTSNHS